MKLSRIDFIGLNGNDGLHYEEEVIMSMTRKDFEAIAKIIKQYHIASGIMGLRSGDSIANVDSMANDLADYFKQANSAFDKERFMKACGYEEP